MTCLGLAFLIVLLGLSGLGDSVGSTLGALLPSLAVGFVGGLVCVAAVGGRLTPAGEAAFFTYASTTGSKAGDGVSAAMNRVATKGLREISGKLRAQLQEAARRGYAAPLVAGGAAAVAVPVVMEVTWCGAAPGQSARAGSAGGGGGGCGTGSCGAGAAPDAGPAGAEAGDAVAEAVGAEAVVAAAAADRRPGANATAWGAAPSAAPRPGGATARTSRRFRSVGPARTRGHRSHIVGPYREQGMAEPELAE